MMHGYVRENSVKKKKTPWTEKRRQTEGREKIRGWKSAVGKEEERKTI